jgi:hypothetical protein
LDTWEENIRLHGWERAVDSILASTEYNNGFGDDAVPGGGRAQCVSPTFVLTPTSSPVIPEVTTANFVAFVAMVDSVIPEMSMNAKVRTTDKLDRLLLM